MSQPREDVSKPTILVVEDDHNTVEMIQMMLQMRGYNVLIAYSGLEAIDMIQDTVKQHSFWHALPIDLILLDVMMPGIDGFKVCQRVKDDPVLKYIPVIMVTARENASDKVAAIEFGADGYITKPFRPEELGSAIKAKLHIKRREEELLRRNIELETINAVMSAAASSLNPDRVLEASLAALMNHTPLAAAAIYLYDETSNCLRRILYQGVERPETLPAEKGMMGDVLRTRQACIQTGSSLNDEWEGKTLQDTPLGARIGIPLRGVERSLGVLEVYDPHPYDLEKYELDVFTTIGHCIGNALENAQLFRHTQTLLTKSYEVGTAQT